MNFKKIVNGSWHSTPHYIHNTSTDTITTLPAVVYPTGTTATVGLKGQTTQSSIPSPASPVMPQGTGDKTANLWDEDYEGISQSLTYKPVYLGDGQYTLSSNMPFAGGTANIFFLAGNVSSGASTVTNGVYDGQARTVSSVEGYATIVYRSQTADPSLYNTMLNTGSEALPYEPYGYKIPISSASTTTPVYLGEVETTRKVKKLVLRGTSADGNTNSTPQGIIYVTPTATLKSIGAAYCTHFKYVNQGQGSSMPSNSFTTSGGAGKSLWFKTDYATVADFQSYLAAQYANGTPVTVWYVLATPTTGIVNEPLMRIGDYADTLSGVSIPVTAGGDTLSVGTTVQPSEVTVNYKGWHPVADVHEFTGNYTVGTMQTLPISELETHTISDLQGGEWS